MSKSTYKEKELFATGAQTVFWITDDGDNSEPETLEDGSLIRIVDDMSREVVMTARELDALTSKWLLQKRGIKP
jgi:hypothetical protein